MKDAQIIAVLADSCCDVPEYLARELGICTVSMHINYADATYRDRVDIQPEEVYARFEREIPRTSTPAPADVAAAFEAMAAEGVTHVVAVSISSNLSATCDLMRSVATGHRELAVEVVDTGNIGLGAGLVAIEAARLARRGVAFDEVVRAARAAARGTHAFFCPDTLDYLFKGGRMSRAAYSVGSALDIRPVLTCDAAGKFTAAAKAHGRKASLKKALSLVKKEVCAAGIAGESDACAQRVRLAVVHGGAPQEARGLLERLRAEFPAAPEPLCEQISPALVVHTGPGLVGVGVQVLP